MTRTLLVTALLAVVPVASAHAQGRSQAIEQPPLKAEIGLVGAGFLLSGSPFTYGPGLRVSTARDHRFSFEIGVDWMELAQRMRRYPKSSDQVMWFYFWQMKHALNTRDESGPRLFAAYGTAGLVLRGLQGFGSDARFTSELIPPLFPMIGFGGQHVVAKHAAVRVDAQLVWTFTGIVVMPRFSAGMSIPIGG
jgi:hypothetical protein